MAAAVGDEVGVIGGAVVGVGGGVAVGDGGATPVWAKAGAGIAHTAATASARPHRPSAPPRIVS